MIILDTNVLSELMRRAPNTNVIAWLDRQPRISVWTTSVTVFEIRVGLSIMPHGKRRLALMQSFEVLLETIGRRIVSFDTAAAGHASELMASRRVKGRTVEVRNTMIAGIALAQHAALATRNTAHFEEVSVPLVNPWSA